ncbi:MAG: Putative regulatory protein [uncultured Nocardioidaceae bacterium]|uniref:Regulatory protein n=1 Tax=uncultured Nocardioidaceae bacterium TaxID=253824 RepID=A0A6J4LS56_9ACTN|nr:MAG: Putative regulatory protein [uncultured Nocardioidaceae bacterium]
MANSFGPEQRRLLDTVAAELYGQIADLGWVAESDPLLSGADEAKTARDLLVDMGLLAHDQEQARFYPVDPAYVQAQVVVPLGTRGTELLAESARWADTFSSLARTYRQSSQLKGQPLVELDGPARINTFIQAALADCREELLTAQPHGRRPQKVLKEAVDRDLHTLGRGIEMRTLYQHAARHSPATREYVTQVIAGGAEVRTLDEFFRRLIVIDRRLAIVPSENGDQRALAIYEKSLVAYLVDIFERSWERGLPFTDNESQTHRDIAADTRRMSIRMLVEGHSDPASAKRLGVSTRTYAAYIAALKEEYGVDTRFQLGYAMGRERPAGENAGQSPGEGAGESPEGAGASQRPATGNGRPATAEG